MATKQNIKKNFSKPRLSSLIPFMNNPFKKTEIEYFLSFGCSGCIIPSNDLRLPPCVRRDPWNSRNLSGIYHMQDKCLNFCTKWIKFPEQYFNVIEYYFKNIKLKKSLFLCWESKGNIVSYLQNYWISFGQILTHLCPYRFCSIWI